MLQYWTLKWNKMEMLKIEKTQFFFYNSNVVFYCSGRTGKLNFEFGHASVLL